MEKYVSNSGLEFIILSRNGKNCVIQFVDTGYTRSANIDNIKAGKVRDVYNASVYSRGYYGEFEKVSYWKQAQQLWKNMLKRCYSEKDPRGYFKWGTRVDNRWLCFANFLADLPTLDNFEKWLLGQREGKYKFNLDKDMKLPGNNIYCREACSFVEDSINKSAGAKSKLVDYYRSLSK